MLIIVYVVLIALGAGILGWLTREVLERLDAIDQPPPTPAPRRRTAHASSDWGAGLSIRGAQSASAGAAHDTVSSAQSAALIDAGRAEDESAGETNEDASAAEIARLSSALDAATAAAETDKTALTRERAAALQEVKRLRNRLLAADATAATAAAEADARAAAEAELDALRARADDAEGQAETQAAEAARLAAELETAQARITDAESKAVDAEAKVVKAANAAKSNVASSAAETARLAAELGAAKEAAATAEAKAADAEAKVADAEAKAADAEAKVADAEAKAADAEAKVADAEAKAADAEAKAADAEAKAADAEAKVADAEAKAADAEAKVADAEAKVADAEAKVADAEAKVADAEAKVADAEAKAADAEAKVADAEAAQKDAPDVDALTAERDAAQQEAKRLRRRLWALESQSAQESDAQSGKSAQTAQAAPDHSAALAAAQAEITRLSAELDDVKKNSLAANNPQAGGADSSASPAQAPPRSEQKASQGGDLSDEEVEAQRLIDAGVDDLERPDALLDAPNAGEPPDDLRRIHGVGPKLEKLLNDNGVYYFRQLAAFRARDIAWIDAQLDGFKGRIVRDRWAPQARQMIRDGAPPPAPAAAPIVVPDALSEAEEGAARLLADGSYNADSRPRPSLLLDGPTDGPADDLKLIKGVAKVLEGVLNELGVYYFRQIAQFSAEDIAWVDTKLRFKGRVVRERWAPQAAELHRRQSGSDA